MKEYQVACYTVDYLRDRSNVPTNAFDRHMMNLMGSKWASLSHSMDGLIEYWYEDSFTVSYVRLRSDIG